MKNIIILSMLILLLSASPAYADADDMMGYSMMDGTGMLGFGLIGIFYLILVFFIFSAVFWLTYKWIIKEDKVMEKKKAK